MRPETAVISFWSDFETVSVATWIPRLECGNIGTRVYEFNANGVYEKSNYGFLLSSSTCFITSLAMSSSFFRVFLVLAPTYNLAFGSVPETLTKT